MAMPEPDEKHSRMPDKEWGLPCLPTRGPFSSPGAAASSAGRSPRPYVPWTLFLSAMLGVWLMAAPAALGISGGAADSHYLAGALVVTWAVIAFGQVARPVRLLNILMGLWIAAAPWLLSGATDLSRWTDIAAGGLLIALSIRRGRIHEQFGGWNRLLI
jgi:hypothetical protein